MDPAPADDPSVSLGDIFSTRKPRDWKAGLSSGAKSLAKGVLGGCAGVVAAPTLGAISEGGAGFAKGLAAGVAGLVVMPVLGAGVGVAQVFRGVAATPEAVRARARGAAWDRSTRAWVDAPESALATAPGGGGGLPPPRVRPASQTTDLYAVLGVERTADAAAIRRAFRSRARLVHPDKAAGVAAAAAAAGDAAPAPSDAADLAARFQALARAYEILADPAARAAYDRGGLAAVEGREGAAKVDGAAFFSALFGEGRFESIIGELALASAARAAASMVDEGTEGGTLDALRAGAATAAAAQAEREAALARTLSRRLRGYTHAADDAAATAWVAAARAEGDTLAASCFGVPLLRAVAKTYAAAAEREAAGAAGAAWISTRSAWGAFSGRAKAAGAAVRVAALTLQMEEADRRARVEKKAAAVAAAEETSEEGGAPEPAAAASAATAAAAERARLEAAALPAMLAALWAAAKVDVSGTLATVAKAVVRGETTAGPAGGVEVAEDVSPAARAARAAALGALADAWGEAAAAAATAHPASAWPRKTTPEVDDAAEAAARLEKVAEALSRRRGEESEEDE